MATLLYPRPSSRVQRDRNLANREAASVGAARLDLDLLGTYAVRGICHSRERISWGATVLVAGRAPETVAATDDVVVRASWLQQELQQGPDVAQLGGQLLVSKDLAADQRWPDFGRMCAAVLGLRSMVSLRVPVPGIHARMNYFSVEPTAFEHLDVDAALRLAQVAAAAIAREAQDVLAVATESPGSDFSKVAVALGIVMAQYRLGSADGFSLLRQAARVMHNSLFCLAVQVVREGDLPEAAIAGLIDGPFDSSAPTLTGAHEPDRHVGCPDMWRTPPPSPTHPSSEFGHLTTPTARCVPSAAGGGLTDRCTA